MMNVNLTSVFNYTPSGFGKKTNPTTHAQNFGDVLALTKKINDNEHLSRTHIGDRPPPPNIAPPGLQLATREQAAATKAHYEAIAAAEAAKKNIPAPNTSLRWFNDSSEVYPIMSTMAQGMIRLTIGKDELLGLMDEIEKAIADGKCYTTAIQKLYDSHIHVRGIGYNYDSFLLDPLTGRITHALPKGFSVGKDGYHHSQRDDDAVWDLAYDLQQFFNLRVFGNTGDLSEKEIDRIIADIKESQANKCTWRFDSCPK
jgi:hypothetical protein